MRKRPISYYATMASTGGRLILSKDASEKFTEISDYRNVSIRLDTKKEQIILVPSDAGEWAITDVNGNTKGSSLSISFRVVKRLIPKLLDGKRYKVDFKNGNLIVNYGEAYENNRKA